ncbi:MAG: SpoIIE family protein phosphatase [Acidobacteria bacterium]|nr:SpoIIE family protein phosphatase [Acidobacteriota bacterium]
MTGARLEIADPGGRTRVLSLGEDRLTIGRSQDNTLVLNGAQISRQHAEIVKMGGRFVLRDLGSRAGIFVNDETVSEHALGHGDRIRIGRHANLRFLVGETESASTHTASSAIGDLRQTATLLEGLRALGTATVLDQVLTMVIDYAITLSGAERGFILLVAPSGALEFTVGRGRSQATLPGHTFATSQKIPREVFATGRPQLVADLGDDLHAEAHAGTVQLGIRTVYCVPLRVVRYLDGAPARPAERRESNTTDRIGVLYLDSRETGSLSARHTQQGLETLAAEAAVAIDNARLYRESLEKSRLDREMRHAYEFQQALLPAAPVTRAHFAASAEMVPCLSIGGDFYDYVDLGDSLGFVVGDVSGKGAAAGLLGARVQEIFAHRAPGNSPSAAVAAINQALVRKRLSARFVTLFYGVLAPTGELTYCNAGHNAPFLVGPRGVQRLTIGGLIVGLFAEAEYEQGVVPLHTEDILLTFSDGVSEALSTDGEEFGDDRILACLTGAPPDLSPDGLVARVIAAVREFTVGEPQNDDITVLVVRFLGDAAGAASD